MAQTKKIKEKRGHLYRTLQTLSIVPVLVLGLLITIFSFRIFTSTVHNEVESELKNITDTIIVMYDYMYPGDYALVGDVAFEFVKGGTVLTRDYTLIDAIKENTGMDITIFYHDTRILTTICDAKGERIIGTGAENRIIKDVLMGGEGHFYTNAVVNGVAYFAYYSPLKNNDGNTVGIVYAGKPCSTVNAAVVRALAPLLILTLLSALAVGYISSSYTNKLIKNLQHIRDFLSKVSTGNLSTEMSPSVLSRGDELSEMARSAMHMQRSLHTLVEEDILTSLPNRRFGDKKLKQIHERAILEETVYSLALADIDFFKKVNDTYGHECGDLVLQKVSDILKRNMTSLGHVARWGGEEFLLVFERMEKEHAVLHLRKMLDEIRQTVVYYDGGEVRVTMTFGVAESYPGARVRQLLNEADEKLYDGKATGRNTIVS